MSLDLFFMYLFTYLLALTVCCGAKMTQIHDILYTYMNVFICASQIMVFIHIYL